MTGENLVPETADEKAFFNDQQSGGPEPAAPAPEPQPEPQPTPEPAPEAEAKQRFVPHEALHEERIKRQSLQEELNRQKTTVETMERRFRELMDRFANKEPTATEPDPETDPIEYIKAKGQQLDQLTRQQQQQIEQANTFAEFQRKVMAAENEFRAQQTDYDQAVKFAIESRHKDLEALGYNGNERAAMIEQEIIGLAQRHLNAGENPARRFYDYARMRGYGAKTSEPTNKIAEMAAKQQAARSPGAVNGAPPEMLTLESLSHMTDDEFDKQFDKMWKNT